MLIGDMSQKKQSFHPAPRQPLSSHKYQRPEATSTSSRQGVAIMGPLKLEKENVVPYAQGKNPKSKSLYFVAGGGGNRNVNKVEKKWTDVVGPSKPKQKKAQSNNKAVLAEGEQKRKIIDVPSYCSMVLFHNFLNTHSTSSHGESNILFLQDYAIFTSGGG
jgi:hypothetical protein